ncbi:hypothetical protein ACWCPF_32595 [Streptomyces sp. NPDC001858]
MATTTDPSCVDLALVNPRAVRLVAAFKDALARMRDEEGLTFDDLNAAAPLIQKIHTVTGVPLALAAMPLYREVFRGRPRRLHPLRGRQQPHLQGRFASYRQPRHPADAAERWFPLSL